MTTIGLLYPGEMGAALGAALVAAGRDVRWASEGRSAASIERAVAAGLVDAGTLAGLLPSCDVVLSVCPPHAALGVARAVAAAAATAGDATRRPWLYVDANAISPATTRLVDEVAGDAGARFVDGGIVGPPPARAGTTRLYLSGPHALDASAVLGAALFEIHVLGDEVGAASALKLAYAAWTKGSAALLLAARDAAERAGVQQALEAEWRDSQPDLPGRLEGAQQSARRKGWRWVGEMEEVAAMFRSLGLPGGFHEAAAEIFAALSAAARVQGRRE